jgi:large subunit ribosomal protein L4
LQIPVLNREGEAVGEIDVRDDVFAVPFNEAIVHQAIVWHLANRRQGTASTKGRGEVSGSTRKIYRQKGTGGARHGARRAPIFRGGGITFGPKPRDHRQTLPKKMRRLALRALLSARAGNGQLAVVDSLAFDQPQTKAAVMLLERLGTPPPVLVVTKEPEHGLILSMHNIERARTTPALLLSAYDVYAHRHIVMTVDAVRAVEAWLGIAKDAN